MRQLNGETNGCRGYKATEKRSSANLPDRHTSESSVQRSKESTRLSRNGRNGSLDVWEVDSRIHEYHQNAARELWKKYNYVDAQETVAFAVFREVIKLDEIPDEVRDFVEHRVESIRSFQHSLLFTEEEANGIEEGKSE